MYMWLTKLFVHETELMLYLFVSISHYYVPRYQRQVPELTTSYTDTVYVKRIFKQNHLTKGVANILCRHIQGRK